jgi:hypothetical protein
MSPLLRTSVSEDPKLNQMKEERNLQVEQGGDDKIRWGDGLLAGSSGGRVFITGGVVTAVAFIRFSIFYFFKYFSQIVPQL